MGKYENKVDDFSQSKSEDKEFQDNFMEAMKYLAVEKKINEIKQKSSDYFDKIISFAEVEIDSSNQEQYEISKKIFVNTVEIQCYENKLLSLENIFPANSLLGLMSFNPNNELTHKRINEIIYSQAGPIVLFLRILKPHHKKIKNEHDKLETIVRTKEKQIKNIKKEYQSVKKRADIMTGKKLTNADKIKYLKILDKQKGLMNKYGARNRKASLLNSVRHFDKYLNPRQVKSISETIRYHQKHKNLPSN